MGMREVGPMVEDRGKKNTWMFPKIVGFPPKSSILIGVSIINHPFWGTPIFGNTYVGLYHDKIDKTQHVPSFLEGLWGYIDHPYFLWAKKKQSLHFF